MIIELSGACSVGETEVDGRWTAEIVFANALGL